MFIKSTALGMVALSLIPIVKSFKSDAKNGVKNDTSETVELQNPKL